MRTGRTKTDRITVTEAISDNSGNTTPQVLHGDTPAGFGADSGQSDAFAPRSRGRKWANRLGIGFLTLFLIAAAAAAIVRLPYFRIAPGTVYDTAERIEAPTELEFDTEGGVDFVTVSQTADISAWQWLGAQFDDDVLIRHEDEVLGDQTNEERREQDQRRIELSKNSAVVVALQRLGHELEITPLGVEVAAIFDCSGADGLLRTGDVIVGVDGDEITLSEELLEALSTREIGDSVDLTVDRIDPNNSAGSIGQEEVTLTLGSADDACLAENIRAEEPRPFIGISIDQHVREDLPFDVEIDTGRVGGPSAGLSFTLTIIDVLSEGELTNGMRIVATGTIDRAGNVGPVGGVHQKTVAADDVGADVFIVPMCCDNFVDGSLSNYEEALLHAEDVQIIGVNTLDEALEAIGELGGNVEPFLSVAE